MLSKDNLYKYREDMKIKQFDERFIFVPKWLFDAITEAERLRLEKCYRAKVILSEKVLSKF